MKAAWFAVTFYVRTHVKWLWPFAGAVFAAVRPLVESGHLTLTQGLAAAALVCGAVVTYVVPNTEDGVAEYAKAFAVTALAGIGAAQAALPGGISRADLWTIGTAVAVAAGSFLSPTVARKAVQASGAGRMGDTAELDPAPDEQASHVAGHYLASPTGQE